MTEFIGLITVSLSYVVLMAAAVVVFLAILALILKLLLPRVAAEVFKVYTDDRNKPTTKE